jgi:hypothetical protein
MSETSVASEVGDFSFMIGQPKIIQMYCFSFWNLFVEFQPTQMVDFSLLAV